MEDLRRCELKVAIWQSGLSQGRIARKLGMSQAWLSLVVNGVNDPAPQHRQAIAGILGKSEDELFPKIANGELVK